VTPAQLTWDQILAWRLRRQYLEAPAGSAIDVVRRLCGVQAQVASAAELAVGVRLPPRSPGAVARAIEERALIKTWAMRGTLHLLPADMAGAYLALIGSLKTWESPSWQKAFISAPQIEMLAEIAGEVLEGRTLSRDDLVAEVQARSHDARLAEHLRSGWAAVLKPLAWRGLLCQGPAEGNRVTFTSPRTWSPAWGGIPDQDEAARIAIPAYLGAYGPASMNAFDAWLTRGASSKRSLREWFTAAGDLLTAVEVDGERAFARSEDLEDMMGNDRKRNRSPAPGFRPVPPGTGDRRQPCGSSRPPPGRQQDRRPDRARAGRRRSSCGYVRDARVHARDHGLRGFVSGPGRPARGGDGSDLAADGKTADAGCSGRSLTSGPGGLLVSRKLPLAAVGTGRADEFCAQAQSPYHRHPNSSRT